MSDTDAVNAYAELQRALQSKRWDLTLAHKQGKCEIDCSLCKADLHWLEYLRGNASRQLRGYLKRAKPPESHARSEARRELKELRHRVKALEVEIMNKTNRIALIKLTKGEQSDTMDMNGDDPKR